MKAIALILGFLVISTTKAVERIHQLYILEGFIAQPRQFPYMVSLHCERINTDGHEWGTSCGASLISEDFVLTAAHCLLGDNIVNIKLIFGSTNCQSNVVEPYRVVLDVPKKNAILHVKYDEQRRKDDIALVRLNQKIKFSSWIQPVRLPARSQTNLDGDVGIVTGWGSIGNSTGDYDALRYAQLRILPDEKCQNVFGYYYHESNLCIDGSRQSICNGDSGGPAVIVDRRDRQFTLVGVSSYGSRKGCDKGEPTGFARVTSFLDWIHNHTGIPIRD